MIKKSTAFKLSFSFLVLFLIAAPVFAAQIVGPENGSSSVSISSQSNYKNLYTAAGNVTINDAVTGDLTAAGGTVVITGQTQNEATLAGGTIDLSGPVGGTARLAGGNITVNAPIGGDLAVAGGNVDLSPSSVVKGDLLAAGKNLVIDGSVNGDAHIYATVITINGTIGGNLYVKSRGQLVFGSGAQVSGNIYYSGEQTAQVDSGAKLPRINYTQLPHPSLGQFAGLLTLAFLIKLLAWLVAAFVVVRFKKNFVLGVAEDFRRKPWSNLGWGLVAFAVAPIATVLLFLTFIGYYLGLMLGLIYALVLTFTFLLSAIVLGYVILARLNKPGELPVDWQAIVIGVFIWFLLGLIPILGWLVMIIVFLMVLGTGIRQLFLINQTPKP